MKPKTGLSSIKLTKIYLYYQEKKGRTYKLLISEMKGRGGTSLVAHWLRICLPMQGTQVQSLVQKDPTCRGATKPMCHNY